MAARPEATLDDLYRTPAKKAELVNGRVVVMPLSGGTHGYAALMIAASLHAHGRRTQQGYAVGDGVAFIVNLPNRGSFCPDAAFTRGPLTTKFVDGAPMFAAEVRSNRDFGPAVERRLASKRADYFAAGTLVVWDVDTIRDHVVRVYRASNPTTPVVCGRADHADAEPAVPGWQMPVADLYPT